MSPFTEASALSTATAFPQQPQFASPQEELLPVIKRRKSAKQASEARAEAQLRIELYNQRFKNAFKEGTDLLSKRITSKDTATSPFAVN
jgi:predicted helicase